MSTLAVRLVYLALLLLVCMCVNHCESRVVYHLQRNNVDTLNSKLYYRRLLHGEKVFSSRIRIEWQEYLWQRPRRTASMSGDRNR